MAGDNTVQDNVPNGKALILRQYDMNAGYSGTMCEFVDGQTVCECGEENTDVALLYPNGARFNVTLYSYDRCLGGPDNATNQKYKAGTWVKVEDDNVTGVIKHPPSTSGSFEWEKSMPWL